MARTVHWFSRDARQQRRCQRGNHAWDGGMYFSDYQKRCFEDWRAGGVNRGPATWTIRCSQCKTEASRSGTVVWI